MTYLKEKLKEGNITISSLVTWGITLSTFFGGITYASYSATTGRVGALEVEHATLKEQIENIKESTDRIEKKLDSILEVKVRK